MEDCDISTLTLGSKASSLSSSSVFAVSTALARVRIDSSTLDRLSSSTTTSFKHTFTLPNFLTPQESKASLLLLLNKLLLSNSPTPIPLLISQVLNSKTLSFPFQDADATENDLFVLNNASYTLLGISAILDHQSSSLSAFADMAAALSCEALRANVTSFNLMDSGDGHTSKEEVGVASDMRVLLNGSKLVGKNKIPSVCCIRKAHGTLREQAKALHSKMRVELNSVVKLGESEVGSEKAVCTVLLSLASALHELGLGSFARAQSNVESVGIDDLKLSLGKMFGNECPTDGGLSSSLNAAWNLFFGKDYDKFAHEVFVLLGLVWKIVAWEALTAFVVLEAAELNEKIQPVEENGEDSKVDKKKKKVVLGKGTGSILALIRDRFLREKQITLETWVADFLSFWDLAKLEFNDFLLKVRDIVESNESRRLPKIPKVILSSYGYGNV